MKEVSTHLPFETILNCRDLGGIQTKEGRCIKPGKLLRSASLGHASALDLKTLENMHLEDVIDLRTKAERLLEPDRIPQGAMLHDVPAYSEKDIADSAGGQRKLAQEAIRDMSALFESLYKDMIVDSDSQKAWKEFFEIVAKSKGMVLWHCTQGKDRTGLAAALLLHLLDVDEETILQDYLQTNLYMTRNDERDRMIAGLIAPKSLRQEADLDIDAALYARKAYYEIADAAVKKQWGSWKNYLRQAVGIDEKMEQAIRQNVLEG